MDNWTAKDFQLVRDNFIAVSICLGQANDNGAQNKFLMSCYPKGIGTGNALLAATASGKHLARVGHRVDLALAEWNKLPEKERKPGAVQVDGLNGKEFQTHWLYERAPGMLIAKVYTRPLTRNAKGEVTFGTRGNIAVPADRGPAREWGPADLGWDHLWLTEAEWKSLLPANPRVGDKTPVPGPLVERMVRNHIVLEVQGATRAHAAEQILSRNMTLTVEEVSSAGVGLRLDGSVLLAHPSGKGAEVNKNVGYGFDGKYLGYLNYNATKKAFDRFDVVAFGESWSDGGNFHGSRPGRHWTGIAFELPRADVKAPILPPACLGNGDSYFGKRK